MTLQIKKSKDRFCCPAFLEYVRSLSCVNCISRHINQTARTTASHTISVKYAEGSDALAIPQCLDHHPQSSRSAALSLIIDGINTTMLHQNLWHKFLKEKGIGAELDLSQEEFEAKCREAGLTTEPRTKRKNRLESELLP